MQKIHNGAAIIISNKSCSHILVQRKDNTYPLPECRMCISLFGGACDNDETPHTTIARELAEELVLDAIEIKPSLWRHFHLTATQYSLDLYPTTYSKSWQNRSVNQEQS